MVGIYARAKFFGFPVCTLKKLQMSALWYTTKTLTIYNKYSYIQNQRMGFITGIFKANQLFCCVSKLSNSAWSILFKVCVSIPSARATLSMSNPNDLSRSIKLSSSPVKGLCSFGHEWLHCGQEQRSNLRCMHNRFFACFCSCVCKTERWNLPAGRSVVWVFLPKTRPHISRF